MVSIDFGGGVDDETAIPIISTTSDERTDNGDKTTKGYLTAQRTASLSSSFIARIATQSREEGHKRCNKHHLLVRQRLTKTGVHYDDYMT